MQENFHHAKCLESRGTVRGGSGGMRMVQRKSCIRHGGEKRCGPRGEKKAAAHTDGGGLTAGSYSLRCFSVSQ